MLNYDKIELRSEKVRSIIGQIPGKIVRYGTAVISLALVSLLIVSSFVKYPVIISVPVQINTNPPAVVLKAPASGDLYFKNKSLYINQSDTIAIIEKYIDDKFQYISIISPGKGYFISNAISNNTIVRDNIIGAIMPDTIANFICHALVPYNNIGKIKSGMLADIELANYSTTDYGTFTSRVKNVLPFPFVQDGQSYFKIILELPSNSFTNSAKKFILYPEMKGQVNIIISNESILKNLLSRLNRKN